MFVKHCKVEVYLTELKLCEDSNMENVVTRRFSKADTIGMMPIQITAYPHLFSLSHKTLHTYCDILITRVSTVQ